MAVKKRGGKRRIGKRGQVTLFIIIGIVLISAVSAGIFIYSRTKIAAVEEFRVPVIEELPLQMQPVRSYIDNCIIDVGVKGLKQLGERGGYIDPAKSDIKHRFDPTESESVPLTPEAEGPLIPYWWHMSSPNECRGTCRFTTELKPQLKREHGGNSIESQLDNYLNENLRDCLNDFIVFRNQGYTITELGKVDTQTTVLKDGVAFYVEYPIEIDKAGRTKAEEFFVKVPVSLSTIYGAAEMITEFEAQYSFLEKEVFEMVTAFSELDPEKLPPIAELTFDPFSTIYWTRMDVEEKIKGMLMAYIQMLQVGDTLGYEPISVPGNTFLEEFYNLVTFIPGNESFRDISIDIVYLGWDIYFNLNCDGELCVPNSITAPFIPVIGLQEYNFVYDISFPVLVSISSPSDLNNEGYTFNFFLEGNIRDNEVTDADYDPADVTRVPAGIMFCDPNKRNTGDIMITAVNSMTLEPVEGVSVLFTYPGTDDSCFVGATNERGDFKGKFPSGAMNGLVTLVKKDKDDKYLTHYIYLTTRVDEPADIEAYITPILKRKIVIKKALYEKGPWMWGTLNTNQGEYFDMKLEEWGAAILTRQQDMSDGSFDEDFQAITKYTGEDAGEALEFETAPGRYEIEISLVNGEDLEIHDEYCYEKGFIITKEECEPIDIELNESVPSGGLKMNYTFTAGDMAYDYITLIAFAPDLWNIPPGNRKIDDLDLLYNIDEYSKRYRSWLLPRFGNKPDIYR